MGFLHRKAQPAQVTILVFQVQAEPGTAIFDHLQAAALVGLLAPIFHHLPREKIPNFPFKQSRRGITAQDSVAPARLQDRPPEEKETQDDTDHQKHRAQGAGEQQGLTD